MSKVEIGGVVKCLRNRIARHKANAMPGILVGFGAGDGMAFFSTLCYRHSPQ
jgi:hypothetical protein